MDLWGDKTNEWIEMFTPYAIKAIGALVLLLLAWIVAGWVRRLVERGLKKANFDLTLTRFFSNMARWVVLIMAILGILGVFGVQTASFAALIAAGGLAVGLAFQGTLSNFAAGVMLLVFRPFKVGDVVSVAGVTGKVDEIGLFTTTADTPDNRRIILPNGSVFGATIENISFHATRRVDVAVGTDYGADLDQTRSILLEAAKRVPNVLGDPAPAIVLVALGDSSISWAVRVWVDSANYWPVMDALTREVKVALDEAGIGIPFPQLDVHLDKVAG